MKKLILVTVALALLFTLSASAASYLDASKRINFFYQYDGAPADSPGTWDIALENRLYSLYGHKSIFQNSTTSKYLTGRGCCLFSFAHAHQFLLGRAGTKAQMADILYEYLKLKPVWSNTGSSMSPPNAASIYASHLSGYSNVKSYSVSSLSTFSNLSNFFADGKGILIVNAPGHYITAVGTGSYQGTQCVQVVDSVLTGTIRSGRLTMGRSMDFSTLYTPSNAANYVESVHQYWIPYDQFAKQCTIKYAYKCVNIPGETVKPLTPAKSRIALPAGGSSKITITNSTEAMTFVSSNSAVCTVSSDGVVTALKPGNANITVSLKSSPKSTAVVAVTVFEPITPRVVLADTGSFIYTPVLPAGTVGVPEAVLITGPGIYKTRTMITDTYGDIVYTIDVTAVCPDPAATLTVPDSVKVIDNEAFSGNPSKYFVLPESVYLIHSGAFSDNSAEAIIIMNPDAAILPGALETDAVIYRSGITD